jgi:dihydrofolate reductase
MGAVQYYLAQSLDGYLAEADGGLDWLINFGGEGEVEVSDATDGTYDAFFAGVGALAMGSATYEFILAEASDWPYAGVPSWVFTTRTLSVPEGADVRFASGPVAPIHAAMVEAAGGRNVWVVGGGDLAMQFVDAGLLDEVHVTIVPVVLGSGLPTFPRRVRDRLRLMGARPFRNGMVELRYEVVR